MPDRKKDWIARLRVPPGHTIDELLKSSLSMDVWQRDGEALIVAASEETLRELERRRLAVVDRMHTVQEYLERAGKLSRHPPSSHKRKRRGR